MALFKYTLKEFRGRLRQLALTGAAVAVGVAFLVLSVGGSGALVDAYGQSAASDVGRADLRAEPGGRALALPPGAAARAAKVPGVTAVSERLSGQGNVINASGRPLDSRALVTSVAADPELRWQRLASGAWPERAGEVALDQGTASLLGVRPGDSVRVLKADGTTGTARLTGILDSGSSAALSGQPVIAVPQAQMRAYATEARATSLDLSTASGADAGAVADRVKAAIGGGAEVKTHATAVADARDSSSTLYGIVLAAALSFVLIALAVARMVVANTFSVVLAQRARQLALMRCVGASSRQVRQVILLQGLLLGVLASAAGLAAGAATALAGNALLGAMDLGPVRVDLLPGWPTFLLAGVFGVLLTLAAVRGPAKLASRVAPVAALGTGNATLPTVGNRAVRDVFSLALLGLGVLLLISGAASAPPLSLLTITAGAILSFFGVLRLAQWVLPPVVAALAAPARRLFGTTGRLAGQQLRSNPGRTSSAASALLVGVTVAVAAASAIGIVRGGLESTLVSGQPAAFSLEADARGLPPRALADLKASDKLKVTPVRSANVSVGGKSVTVVSTDPARLNSTTEGVDQARALRDGESLGDGLGKLTRDRGFSPLPSSLLPEATAYVTPGTLDRLAPRTATPTAWISPAEGVSHLEARRAIDRALADHPTVRVKDSASDAAYLRTLMDRMMLVVTVLLGFSMAIAALGVAATLMLSVDERTREIGMLRAIGLTGGQLRSLLTLESLLLALTGGVAGTALGITYGWLAARSVATEGATLLGLPWGALTAILAATVLVGAAASVGPARRVRRMRVVDALGA
ncbi:FtsX-like permease family protein [Streptomyces sp. NPDC001941]|uniref:FtsX-like permease family protein n=1 Tax=Streptomyces sp. NPDC001941 TaxID=3154659 RepID=UPI00331BB842